MFQFKTKVDLHGTQCAVATRLVAYLYHKVASLVPDREKALAFVNAFDYNDWAKTLKEFLGASADTMILLELKEGKYNVKAHAKRLEVIIEKWEEIVGIIKSEIPTGEQIDAILNEIGAPKTAKEIGIDCDLLTTLKATKDIRDKYVLSRLAWDLGMLDELLH